MSGGLRVYRCLVTLYPDEFRRRFAEELESDFEEAAHEASGDGPMAVARFWVSVVRDLAFSLSREWLRTPWLPALAVAGTLTVSVFWYAAYKQRHWPRYPAGQTVVSASHDDRQLMGLLVIAVIIPIVGAILGALWVRLLLRRPSVDRGHRRA